MGGIFAGGLRGLSVGGLGHGSSSAFYVRCGRCKGVMISTGALIVVNRHTGASLAVCAALALVARALLVLSETSERARASSEQEQIDQGVYCSSPPVGAHPYG